MKESILAAAFIAVTVLAYVWLISAGQMNRWPTYGKYYDLLAEGFLCGQTNLVVRPHLALLALPDPYDPEQNKHFRLHDASLYKRNYYIYWGPLPAIVLVGVRLLALPFPQVMGDQYLVFGFTVGSLLFSALMLVRIRQRLFPGQAWWTFVIPLSAVAFAAPVVFLLGRASVYEASIMAGQCCLLTGLYFSLRGLEPQVRAKWLLAAGAALAGAMCSRISLTLAVGGLAALVLWRTWRIAPAGSIRRRAIAAFVLPLCTAGALLAAYNQVRFGSPFEFGTGYQLASLNGFRTPAPNVLFSSRYVMPNLYRYLFETMDTRSRFPFIRCGTGSVDWIFETFELPREYLPEPVAGLALSLPFGYLALLAPVAAGWQMLRARKRTAVPPARDLEHWLILCLAMIAMLAMAPTLFVLATTMRYLADVAPAITLLASIGMWQVIRASATRNWQAHAITSLAALLAFSGTTIGVLLAVTGAFGHFNQWNPDLYQWLGDKLQF